jgi:hypothetical protein
MTPQDHRRLGPLLTTERRAVLDSLLVVDDELGITPVSWLGSGH